MLGVLASGTVVKASVERTSSAGRPYVTATLRVPTEDDAVLVSAVAFSDSARRALLALSRGDQAAVTGRAKLTSWERDGETKFGMSVVAEGVLTPYQLEKRRTRATGKQAEPEAARIRPSQAAAPVATHATDDANAGSVADMPDDLPW